MNKYAQLQNAHLSTGYKITYEENCTIFNFENQETAGTIFCYKIFPGLHITLNKIEGEYLPNLLHMFSNDSFKQYTIINYCQKGRCEVSLDDNIFVYQTTGDFSIAKSFSQNGFYFPQKYYEGIELFVDLQEMKSISQFLDNNFNIHIENIVHKLLVDHTIFISKCSTELENLFHVIWSCHNTENALFNIRMRILELFYLLEHSSFTSHDYKHFTATQKEIARKTHEIITTNIEQHFSAKLLADKFKISESSLKKYFKGIYGQNISFYLKDLRLETAAKLLINSKLSVNEIANKVGYLNQSKFSAVFKEHFHVTPLEYRKQRALEQLGEN